MVHQVHTYADLRRQIHDDLRIQHPEWVQPNGESPMCDSYEARLVEMLQAITQREHNRSSDRHRDQLKQSRIWERLSYCCAFSRVAGHLAGLDEYADELNE